MRNKFDEQLEQLNVALIKTGALCEDAISTAAKALLENDMELAKKVKPIELEIDQKEREIENLCMRLLLQQQPVAGDLRQISSALKMITDLERIGDQTSDIAELLPYLQGRDFSWARYTSGTWPRPPSRWSPAPLTPLSARTCPWPTR